MGKDGRGRIVIRTSLIGVVANVLLAAFKIAVGIVSGSIAIILDAVNNLGDVLSSVVTIIAMKLALKPPDNKHPLGFGRIEYVATMIISFIVLYAGFSALKESVLKIKSPGDVDYSIPTIVIICAAVIVKIILGMYVRRVGKKVGSGALVASGTDALNDAILSISVLLSAVVYLIWNLRIEAFIGLLISVFIIKSAIEIMIGGVNEVLGRRADKAFTDKIRATILMEDGVLGANDLILHNYGPERNYGSIHIEVSGEMTAVEIDRMQRRIVEKVYREHNVLLTGISIYAVDPEDDDMFDSILGIARKYPGVLQVHGFFVDKELKRLNVDLVLDLEMENREETFQKIKEEIQRRYPDYECNADLDGTV